MYAWASEHVHHGWGIYQGMLQVQHCVSFLDIAHVWWILVEDRLPCDLFGRIFMDGCRVWCTGPTHCVEDQNVSLILGLTGCEVLGAVIRRSGVSPF